MARFYSSCQGNRGKATRLGTMTGNRNGVITQAAGWQGCIEVECFYNRDADRDEFEVRLTPWGGSGGQTRLIASGILDANIEDPFIPALIA